MSTIPMVKRNNIVQILERKEQEPLVCLTAYNAVMARLADKFCDIILVGDSVAMVEHGYNNTLAITLDMMILHAKSVVNSTRKALIVVDMPFGSYEESPQQAYVNAVKIIKETGAAAVKIEGGTYIADTIDFLTKRGIPVMAHIGLLPQSVNSLGGYRVQGKTEESQALLLEDAKAVEKAGAFAVVLEAMIEPIARKITQSINIPSIGIGASLACDGQILVLEDMLGLNNKPPRFVREYTNLTKIIEQALNDFANDVKNRKFPSEKEIYPL